MIRGKVKSYDPSEMLILVEYDDPFGGDPISCNCKIEEPYNGQAVVNAVLKNFPHRYLKHRASIQKIQHLVNHEEIEKTVGYYIEVEEPEANTKTFSDEVY